jgi:hypothetical protein
MNEVEHEEEMDKQLLYLCPICLRKFSISKTCIQQFGNYVKNLIFKKKLNGMSID